MSPEVSVISLDDGQLIELIREAESRLLFVGPGVSLQVAEAISQKWIEMGPETVSIVLDVDPEVCRLGYGDLKAIQLLQGTAERIGSFIHHRPGIRIGLLVSDHSTVIFSPTPLLIEGESKLPEFLEKVWEVVGRTALQQILGTAEARAQQRRWGARRRRTADGAVSVDVAINKRRSQESEVRSQE